jgi:hypothetical protein
VTFPVTVSRHFTADRLAKLVALITLAVMAARYDIALLLIDHINTPVHSWMLVFASAVYLGFGIQAVIGLWLGRGWGNWGYYLHVLTGTIHFSFSVLPVSPYFTNDYLYFAWFLGGNAAICLAVTAIGRARSV